MARNIGVLILAEDLRQANFVKHFLRERNVSSGIRILPLPAGRGCGCDYVLRESPRQLRALRQSGASAGLVVGSMLTWRRWSNAAFSSTPRWRNYK